MKACAAIKLVANVAANAQMPVFNFDLVSRDFGESFQIAFGGGLQVGAVFGGAAAVLQVFQGGDYLHAGHGQLNMGFLAVFRGNGLEYGGNGAHGFIEFGDDAVEVLLNAALSSSGVL